MVEIDFSLPKLDIRSLPGPDSILRRELSNGIVILAKENFASPSVVISGYLVVGSLGETRQEAGLAHLTALSLMRGTKERSFNQIFESIESIGALLNIGAGTHITLVQGKALAEDLNVLLDLLSEVLRNPTFPKSQIERLKAEQLTALAIRDQDTGARAQLAFDELAYKDHPYSLSSVGYKDTTSEFTTTTIRTFHRQRYGPQGMVIVVVGAVEAKAAFTAVEEALGSWTNPRRVSAPDLPAIEKPIGLLRKAVHLAGKSQCDIVLGTPGPSRFDEDYMAASLGNSILGRFGMYGRIGDAVRESAGLAYYAYSTVSGGPGPGPWQVIAGVNPTGVEKAIDLIRNEIRDLVTRRVTKRELLENQANFIGRLPLHLESNEGVASALLHIERYSLGLDYYQRYPELVAAVTRDDVIRTAKRFLDPDHLAIAIAGPIGEEA
ncbi:MAG TPA: insulinase family protein [Anaerolineae bacterium]|nr:insulinase family protein [Anaerolineae bacterium]